MVILVGHNDQVGLSRNMDQLSDGVCNHPSFSLLINRKPYGNIKPSKGICQVDPFSPYLFLLCAKGFTSLLAKAKLKGRIKGVSICKRAPTISNLMLANNSILF